MDEISDPVSNERVPELFRDGTDEQVREWLERCSDAPVDRRTDALRAIRSVADDRPDALGPFLPTLAPFLTDDERAVRLRTAKLYVSLAKSDPDAVAAVVDALASRLDDDEEFYYVRARSAEALGYVALERPDEVATPAVLADLRIGLSFDEPEVAKKLAKALPHVALGDPARLRHQVPTLAEHLEHEDELVRYHLCTAITAVGCERPTAVVDAVDDLSARLEDDCVYVRGRAAEALGSLARSGGDAPGLPAARLSALVDDDEADFALERAWFALAALEDGPTEPVDEGEVGSAAAIREHADEIVEEITSPDGDDCPHCGLALPENGPPMCPRCGGPR